MIAQQFQDILDRLLALGADYFSESETFRDDILALGPNVMEYVLKAATDPQTAPMHELFITVLTDAQYPPAMPHFIQWLDHENEEIRFVVAHALDSAANKQFGVEGMIKGGWVQHDEVSKAIPAIKRWWYDEGQNAIPSMQAWRAQQESKPRYTEREKWYNFVEINPLWAMLGSGYVIPPKGRLPRNQGMHVVAGQAQIQGEDKPRPVAIELDSDAGKIRQVFVKENEHWIDVTCRVTWVKPNLELE